MLSTPPSVSFVKAKKPWRKSTMPSDTPVSAVKVVEPHLLPLFEAIVEHAREWSGNDRVEEASAAFASVALHISNLVRIMVHDYPELAGEGQENLIRLAVKRGIVQGQRGIRME